MNKRVIHWVLMSWLIVMSQSLFAQSDPIQFLQKTTDQLLLALKQDRAAIQKNPELVYKIVHRILIPRVDTVAMARLTLGPVRWRKITPAQQQAFTREFVELVIRTYSSALSAYKDETVRYYPIRGRIAGQTRLQVRSVIIQDGGRRVPVSYWLTRRTPEAEWKVYDMSVEGVSLLESFRSQFSSELSKMSFPTFLKNLQNHNLKNK